MFIYDKRNGGVTVRRIENKMGIKGSPTCELVFRNAPAELVGSRRMGLIKYVMALMNGARLGIAAQSVGLSEISYREALQYAKELYACSRFVDIYKAYDDIAKERKLTVDEKKEAKAYSRLADAFTPLAKGMSSEFCNQNAYDCIQIHGGSGFMKDYACERVYRDARITSIYEGTTQLQVVAAIRHVTTGTYLNWINSELEKECKPEDQDVKATLQFMSQQLAAAVEAVTGQDSTEYVDFHARRLVEMAGYTVMGLLLLDDTTRNEAFRRSLRVFVKYGQAEVAKHADFISNFRPDQLADYMQK